LEIITVQCYASVVYAVITCLSVRLSITRSYCVKMAKYIITETMPHNSPGTLVFLRQRSRQNLNRVTPTGHQMQVGQV